MGGREALAEENRHLRSEHARVARKLRAAEEAVQAVHGEMEALKSACARDVARSPRRAAAGDSSAGMKRDADEAERVRAELAATHLRLARAELAAREALRQRGRGEVPPPPSPPPSAARPLRVEAREVAAGSSSPRLGTLLASPRRSIRAVVAAATSDSAQVAGVLLRAAHTSEPAAVDDVETRRRAAAVVRERMLQMANGLVGDSSADDDDGGGVVKEANSTGVEGVGDPAVSDDTAGCDAAASATDDCAWFCAECGMGYDTFALAEACERSHAPTAVGVSGGEEHSAEVGAPASLAIAGREERRKERNFRATLSRAEKALALHDAMVDLPPKKKRGWLW